MQILQKHLISSKIFNANEELKQDQSIDQPYFVYLTYAALNKRLEMFPHLSR